MFQHFIIEFGLLLPLIKISENFFVETEYNFWVPSDCKAWLNTSIEFTIDFVKESGKLFGITFQEIFNQPNVNPDLDSVFVEDFGGGMENLGMIVYGMLPFDYQGSHNVPIENLLGPSLELIAHELMHNYRISLNNCPSKTSFY